MIMSIMESHFFAGKWVTFRARFSVLVDGLLGPYPLIGGPLQEMVAIFCTGNDGNLIPCMGSFEGPDQQCINF